MKYIAFCKCCHVVIIIQIRVPGFLTNFQFSTGILLKKRQRVKSEKKKKKTKNKRMLYPYNFTRNTKVQKSFMVPKDINSKSTGKSYEYICN
jgi:hypothetical protein